MPSMKVLITGGNGNIAKLIAAKLDKLETEYVFLSRSIGSEQQSKKKVHFLWNPSQKKIDTSALEGVTHVLHLAGAGIATKAWTQSYKQEIVDSRVASLQFLLESLKSYNNSSLIKKIVSTSATGIYPNSSQLITEDASFGSNFLSSVCRQWEQAAMNWKTINAKIAIFRVGIVLSKNSGFLPETTKTKSLRILPILGHRQNLISWIHEEDMANMFIYALLHDHVEGVYNAVAPNPVSNQEFINQYEKSNAISALNPVIPEFVLKMMLGERSSVVLTNQNISSEKIIAAGFKFKFTSIKTALENLIS